MSGSPVYPNRFLTLTQAREVLPMSEPWFAKMRTREDGPPFVRIGTRIFYPHAELIAWAERHSARPVANGCAVSQAA